MAVSPTKLSAAQLGAGVLSSPPVDWRFLLSRANSSRAMDAITLIQRDEPWLPGMFVTAAGDEAALAADIDAILCAGTSTKAGPRSATVVTRDAEVEDAYLIYGAMVVKDVHERLSQLAIIVRQGVLPNTTAGTFDPSKAGTPPVTGIPSSTPPVPPATLAYPQPASFAPTTLEAAEPVQMPGAGSPQPAPPTVPPADAPLVRREGELDEDFRARQESQRQERERQERERTPPAPTPPPPEAPRT